MKKIIFFIALFLGTTLGFSQETIPKPNYRLASRFSPTKIGKLVHSTSVRPNWLKRGNRFWYQYKTTKGSKYYIVDADAKKRTMLFDNAKMAKWLSEITKDAYDAQHLPRFSFKFVKNETAIRFRVTSAEKVPVKEDEKEDKEENKKEEEKDKKKAKKKKPKMEKKTYHLEYRLGGNGLTIIDNDKKKEKKWQRWANIAPDSSIVLYSKNYNLYWMDKENFLKATKDEKASTIVENKWTKDGVENYGFGGGSRGQNNETKEKEKDKRKGVYVIWSRNSKKFVFQRTDSRMIKDLWVINSVSKKRPTLETFKYHMPGEQEFYKRDLLIFDVPSKDIMKVKLDTVAQKSISVYTAPRKKSIDRDQLNPTLLLSKKGKVYFSTISRDRKRVDIHVADINSGEVKTLIEEHSNVYIENRGHTMQLFNNESEILHWSERDGWGHFYLYSSDGTLKRQVTNGPFHVSRFEGINEKERTVYFTANGVSKGRDPYYSHLYKINLNGTGMRGLNSGDFNSNVNVSDSKKYFVSNFSRVNTVPKSELRNSNGSLIMKLEEADLSELFATGYKFPEPFKVKADDGITDIYGVMYKPFDFDETKKYPLLEYVYPGPQTEAVNKSF
ncbi:MAG: DPP IV N-terminal domain-containing protein, partial [Flavobacteriaceae bacterium]|nr:DPP IV N-terminal domain-containing protein [Flavobacteriaceae bacterium]